MVEIQHLTKTYGKSQVLNVPALDVPKSEILSIVGNNGAGKTTLLKLLIDLLMPDTGYVKISGHQVNKSEEWKKLTRAYLNEDFLISFLTPIEYLNLLGDLRGYNRISTESHINRYISFLGEALDSPKKIIHKLSSGNKMKVGIAGCLIHNPELIILDEPFTHLDPRSSNLLKEMLTQINKETGCTVIFTNHQIAHSIEIAHRILLLKNGAPLLDVEKTDFSEIEQYFSETKG